jgi:hypothetical protein
MQQMQILKLQASSAIVQLTEFCIVFSFNKCVLPGSCLFSTLSRNEFGRIEINYGLQFFVTSRIDRFISTLVATINGFFLWFAHTSIMRSFPFNVDSPMTWLGTCGMHFALLSRSKSLYFTKLIVITLQSMLPRYCTSKPHPQIFSHMRF